MKLKELRHNLWNVGFYEEGVESLLTDKSPKVHWARKKFKDRWFADPFILDVNDSEIIILAEEYCYDVKRGRLARVVFDRNSYAEKDYTIILDLPTHLSFPFIYRRDEKVFIMPENSASGCSTIYEYDDYSRRLTAINQVSDEPYTDATIFQAENKTWLWTTKTPDPNGNVLMIYDFDNTRLCVNKKCADVSFSTDIARNAGECFMVNGFLYRPAQDCTKCYGHGVVIQKCIQENGKWHFMNTNSFYPRSFKYNQGIHTLNHYKGLVVFDTRGFRYPVIGRIANCFINIRNIFSYG